MTEQEKCIQEAHDKYFNARPDFLQTHANTRYFEAGFDRGWQAAIASREPAKEIDMEALKRGQENAAKIWTPEAAEEVLGAADRKPMPLEKAEELAHVTASKYTHRSDPLFTAYTFLPHTLSDFVRKVERFHGIGR